MMQYFKNCKNKDIHSVVHLALIKEHLIIVVYVAYQWAIDIQGRNGPYPYISAFRKRGDESKSSFQTGCQAVSSYNLKHYRSY